MTAEYCVVIDAGRGLEAVAVEQRATEYTAGYLSSWNSDWSSPLTKDSRISRVSERDALGYSPIFSGIAMIAGDVSGMPWETKQRGDDKVTDALDHPTRELLLHRTVPRGVAGPGEYGFTSNIMVETMVWQACFYGTGGCRIHRDPHTNRPVKLELIRRRIQPHDTQVRDGEGWRFYRYTDDNGHSHEVSPEDMLILNGPAMDGWRGMGVFDVARRTIGKGAAIDELIDELLTSGNIPKGFFRHPMNLTEPAEKRFLKSVDEFDRKRYMMLLDGMEFQAAGIDPKDAMLVELMGFTGGDAARFLKIPPSKLGLVDAGKSPAKSAEQEQRNYFSSCLHFWIDRLQREAHDKLFREDERDRYFTSFNTRPFMIATASLKERVEADKTLVLSGIRRIDEVREENNWNPHPDGAGAKPLLPRNATTDVEALGDNDDDPPKNNPVDEPPGDAGDRTGDQTGVYMRDVVRASLHKMVDRLEKSAANAAKKSNRFLEFVDKLETNHRAVVINELRPGVALIGYTTRRDSPVLIEETADDLFAAAREKLLSAAECTPDELAQRVKSAGAEIRNAADKIADQLIEV